MCRKTNQLIEYNPAIFYVINDDNLQVHANTIQRINKQTTQKICYIVIHRKKFNVIMMLQRRMLTETNSLREKIGLGLSYAIGNMQLQ